MPAANIEIRAADTNDESAIVPLMALFNHDEGIPWQPTAMIPALRRVLGDASLGVIVLALDRSTRAPVGYGLATFGYDIEFAGRDAFITELFVDERFRRRGVGRLLLDSLVERLRACEVNAVHLMVRPENTSARALYEQHGFQVIPRLLMTHRLAPAPPTRAP